MLLLHEIIERGSFFGFSDDWLEILEAHSSRKGIMHIFWNKSSGTKSFFCDDHWLVLPANSIATLTSFHHIKMDENSRGIISFFFNRDFYCLRDHDQEISCNGILFFGAQQIPIVKIPDEKTQMFEALFQVFMEELKIHDPIQNEMLLALLKRFIIQITRLAKDSYHYNNLNPNYIETVRKFHLIVDENFRKKKKVIDYALPLGIAAKTLTNLMAAAKQDAPLNVIHNRIILEVKRLLLYGNQSWNEISENLNFDDPSQLSKLFKKKTNYSPMDFKKNYFEKQLLSSKGKIDKKKGNPDIYRLTKIK